MHEPIAAFLWCATALAAQELHWNLPPHGAAVYLRQLRATPTVEPAHTATEPPWGGEAAAPVVLAGELDAKSQRVAEPPCDLRDVWPRLAFDLGRVKPGKVELELPGNGWLQPVFIVATYGPVGEDDSQTIEVAFAGPGDAEEFERQARVTGSLRGRRTIDRRNGRVAAATVAGELSLAYPAVVDPDALHPSRRVRLPLTDELTFDRLVAPTEAQFRTMVNDGIRKALAAIRHQLGEALGRPADKVEDPHLDPQPGELGLALLALVKGGADPREQLVQRGYDDLRRRVIEGTYSLACAILAVEALYTPPSEWQELRAGRLKAPLPRELTDADRAVVAAWTRTLLQNVDSTVKSPYVRRWRYGPSTSFDNSNTQYAMLGLYAAQLCGVDVPATTWTAAANHWLQSKIAAGEPGAPLLVSHADYEQGKRGRTRAAGGKVPCVGWSYGATGDVTGSMTCAGVSGLTLCAAALRAQKKAPPQFMHELDDATRGGFLWLERNLSVRRNPGPSTAWNSWYYYYLYGLERTCELNQIALLGDVDWYFDGAMQLLLQQHPDGGWGSAVDTCFALLFLKKAALPAITGH